MNEFSRIAEYAKYHHERIDGTGYPEGLKADEIPLISRIISVVDAYEAMTSDRPYRSALTKNEAIQELILHSGTQFDKDIVKVFINKVLINK
jgi:HD-GYP domain-containing protein (c-di-GMP phosphodiesterase class II)